jgi:carbonic anhydrase/acetyltransferase-like protein (isoleucine patch superfamily)
MRDPRPGPPPVVIGDDVLVGPHAHVNGAQIGDGCFLATGAALFPGSVAGTGGEVRVGGVPAEDRHTIDAITEASTSPAGGVDQPTHASAPAVRGRP